MGESSSTGDYYFHPLCVWQQEAHNAITLDCYVCVCQVGGGSTEWCVKRKEVRLMWSGAGEEIETENENTLLDIIYSEKCEERGAAAFTVPSSGCYSLNRRKHWLTAGF